MPILLADSTINFNSASWKVINSGTYRSSTAAQTVISTTLTTSTTNIPGAINVEGINLIVLGRSSSVANTFTLQLFNSTTSTGVKTVTINTNDIPATTVNASAWLNFKFDAPTLLTAGQSYAIRMSASTTANQVTVYRSATANDFTFNYVTSTTAAPISGDTLFIQGSYTGTTTPSFQTVTYAETGTTPSYSGLNVSSYGILTLENAPNKNYFLSMTPLAAAGNQFFVNGNGIVRFGTSGSPLDNSSTFVLRLPSTIANGNGILIDGIGSEFSAFGRPITRVAKLNANVGANTGNTITTDIVTNWSASTITGDLALIGSSTRGTSVIEAKTITGSTGTTLAFSTNVTNAKSGTTGTQTPVVYLGGNIIFTGSTTTNTFNIRQRYSSKLYLNNVGLSQLGSATSSLRGLMIEGTAGSECIIDSCSFYNNNTNALILPLTTTDNFIIRDCVGAISVNIPIVTSVNTQIISGCTFIGGTNQAIGLTCTSLNTIIFNNNFNGNNSTTVCLTYSPAFTTLRTTPSIYNIEIGAAPGAALSLAGNNVLISGITIWNSATTGLLFGTANASLQEAINLNIYGSGTANIGFATGGNLLPGRFTNCRFGVETFGAANVSNVQFTNPTLFPQSTSQAGIVFDSCVIGNSTLPASTADIHITNAGCFLPNVLFDNCILGSTNRFNISTPTLINGSRVKFQKINNDANQHRTYYRAGYILSDSSIVDTSPISYRAVPESATINLISPLFKVNILSGQSVTLTAKVRKSVVGDGATYNGSLQPSLAILYRNGLGFSGLTYTGNNSSNSFVIDEFATVASATNVANGNWQSLSWVSPVATDNTAIDFYSICNGTTGWVNWDTIRVT